MLNVRLGPRWQPERRYAIGVILGELLGLEFAIECAVEAHTEIRSSEDAAGRSLLILDGLFALPESARLTAESIPPTPVESLDLAPLGLDAVTTSPRVPIVLGSGGTTVSDDRIELGLDIFGTAYFFLTRYEEAIGKERDEHGRFPDHASFAVRAGLSGRPVVDEYAEILWSCLSRLWPGLRRRQRRFRLLPSHDVDWPDARGFAAAATSRAMVADVAFRREPLLAVRRAAGFVSSRIRPGGDLFDTFDFIMDSSEEAGVRSAFYFMTPSSPHALDGRYSLDESWIRELLRRIHDRGHEIGLHPSYESFADPGRIAAEADRLRAACRAAGIEQEAWGGRQHYLRWENPITWRAWDDAGLAYDSTVAFSARGGFRAGACFEYPVFDVVARAELGLRERPLVLMEGALLRQGGVDTEAFMKEAEELARACRVVGGDFTLLWHNSRLLSRAERATYAGVLDISRHSS